MNDMLLKGVGVALVTPFESNGSIDFIGFERLLEHCISGGVDYFVVNGTTAENPSLSEVEKYQALDFVLERNAGRLPVVFGIGGNNTSAVCRELTNFSRNGVSAILSASPYYNKPSQEGIYQHYAALAAASSLPVILYNVPGRTSSNMQASTTLRLANDFNNIIGIKEASGDLDQITTLILDRPQGFSIISGDDNLTFAMLGLGAEGVISVSGQGVPEIFCKMYDEFVLGNFQASKAAHLALFKLTNLLFAEGNPAGVKSLLSHRGVCGPTVRLPLVNATKELDHNIKTALIKLDLLTQ